jgi:alpha-L-fucosidase
VESWTLCPERHTWNRRTGAYTNDDYAYKKSYEALISTFNPTKFNPDKWAAGAKDAGVKYVLVMSKHHDGFCMWNTATTDYRITSPRCPFHVDPRADVIREMSASFRKVGLSVGIYFSKSDWNTPYYWSPEFPLRDRNVNYDTRKYPELWKKFKDFTWKQIEELMTGYGRQDVLWLDGGQVRPPNQDIDVTGMAAMARKHQPGLIVVDRTVHGVNENYVTPEQEIPHKFLPYPWETCMTMGTSWSYKPNDKYKSAGTLIRNLCRIIARGGNYLIGIGPDANGELDPTVYVRFQELGAWLKVNGEAIYATRPVAPYECNECVFTCGRDGALYTIVLAKGENDALPETVAIPAGLMKKARKITLLGHGEIQTGEMKCDQAIITIPAGARTKPPCAYAWTIKIESK